MKMLTIEEAAKFLRIDVQTAYRYAREAKIPAMRVGRNWRVLQETLEAWLKEKAGKDRGAWHRSPAGPSRGDDPLLKVMGIIKDGTLTKNIDEVLYGGSKK